MSAQKDLEAKDQKGFLDLRNVMNIFDQMLKMLHTLHVMTLCKFRDNVLFETFPEILNFCCWESSALYVLMENIFSAQRNQIISE